MPVSEAKEVLGIQGRESYEEVIKVYTVISILTLQQRFSHLYEANEPNRGGSQYIQGKLLSAKEAIDEALQTGKPL